MNGANWSVEEKLASLLAPLMVRRDVSRDQIRLDGVRVHGTIDGFALKHYEAGAFEVVRITLADMVRADPFVVRYRRDEEIEIHPVFGGATNPELLMFPSPGDTPQ